MNVRLTNSPAGSLRVTEYSILVLERRRRVAGAKAEAEPTSARRVRALANMVFDELQRVDDVVGSRVWV